MERADITISLTPMERQVLDLFAAGYTTVAVCERLGRSRQTIYSHGCEIYKKLDVQNRLAAVARASELGLLSSGDDAPCCARRLSDVRPARSWRRLAKRLAALAGSADESAIYGLIESWVSREEANREARSV